MAQDDEYIDPKTWIVLEAEDPATPAHQEISGAFSDVNDAEEFASSDDDRHVQRIWPSVRRADFLWGVLDPNGQVVGTFGGDEEAATAAAQQIGGQLRVLLDPNWVPN